MRKRTGPLMALCMLMVMLLFSSCADKTDSAIKEMQAEWMQEETEDVSGRMEVHFIDVGQGDATLIICDGHAMLFDTGENDKSVLLQFYLMRQGIEHLDYVIGSHPEADHIGGMDVILLKYDCDKVMLPDVAVDTATYRDVLEAMEYKNYESISPQVGETYHFGDSFFTIIPHN